MKLNVISCYELAWRSFSKWWIPLCIISGMVVVFQIVPRLLVRVDANELMSTTLNIVTAVADNDLEQLEAILPRVQAQTNALMRKIATYGLYLFPVIALLTIILLMFANWAVKDSRDTRRPLHTLVYIAFVHVMMAIIKAVAFLFFFVPGAYLYIKLFFVSLIMLEEKKGAVAAIRMSWQMTTGNFWQLFLLVLMNTAIQMMALPTIIGEIPVTGFANTARAAAFKMLREDTAIVAKQE